MFFLEIILTIVNVLIIPIVSVGMYYKNNNKERVFNLEVIYWWALFTILVFLFSKVLYECIYYIFNMNGSIYSFQYCFIAFVVSLVVPKVVEAVVKRFNIEIIVNKNEKKK